MQPGKSIGACRVPFFLIILFLAAGLLPGCAAPPRPDQGQLHPPGGPADFIAVIVREGETLSSLAARYLGDADQGWIIARFNDVADISPGQELVIPLVPFAKADLSAGGYQTVPVLAYHNFSETERDTMVVRRADFDSQMKFLKDNGYAPVSVDDLFDFLSYRREIPAKAVVITIDDGWRGVYDIAFPVLQKYGFPATLFVCSDMVNGSSKTLNWQQLAELERGGVDVQCHTRSHRDLGKRKEDESFTRYAAAIEGEIAECAATVEKMLAKDVKYLAYPYGETNNLVIAYLQKYGYQGAFTVKRGSNPFFADHYALGRSMIYGDFDLEDFRKNLDVYHNEALR